MKYRTLCVLFTMCVAACGDSDSSPAPDAAASAIDAAAAVDAAIVAPDAPPSTSARFYEHWLYPPADCPPDPSFNCAPSVELCPDGTVSMLVTDIMNEGTYVESGSTITATFDFADVPDVVIFTPSGDTSITDDWQQWNWDLNTENQFSNCE